MANNYIAFISYRHLPLDMAVAEKLHKSIEHYRVPKELRRSAQQKYLGRAFRDREELPLSNDLTQDIYEALDASEFLIVVCTPETPKSMWVDREIEHFLTNHDRDHIITVLAAGTAEESVPQRITEIYGPDGVTVVQRREPLCAYLVDTSQRRILRNLNKEFLRLVAAILEKPYDSIRQRQKLYHQRRILAVCGVVAAVSLCFAGMLASKNRQITEQNQQITEQNATIQAQNQQIAQQLEQTLLNESEALSLLSSIRLEEGDRMEALACALSALPSEENPRPFYEPAKVALEDALYLYETGYQVDRQLDGWMEHRTLSDDGRYLLAGTIRQTIACWDLKTGEILWEYPMDDYAVMSLWFALEQNAAVYVSCSGIHYVLDLTDGSLRCQYAFSKREEPVDFSPDGNWMAVTDEETLYLCSLGEQKQIQTAAIEGGSRVHACTGRFNWVGDRFVMLCEDDYGEGTVLHASVFDTQTMKLIQSFDLAPIPTGGKWDLDLLALEDGSWMVLWHDGVDTRYACRMDENGILAQSQLDAPGDAGDRYSKMTSQVCQVGNQVWLVFPDRIWSVNPQSCALLWETELWWTDKLEVCALWEDGSFLALENDKTLSLFTLSAAGDWEKICSRVFPFWSGWNWTGDVVCNASSETFLLCGSSNTYVIRWMEGIGDDFAITEELPIALSGNLIYLPKFCGVWASPSGNLIFIMDTDATEENDHRQYLYRVSDGVITELLGELPGMDPAFTADETRLISKNRVFDLSSGAVTELGEGELWASVRSSDRIPAEPLLTVSYEAGTLRWWLDGSFAGQTTDPGFAPEATVELFPGQNGLVVVRSDSGWRVYDTAADAWHQPNAPMDLSGPVCLGKREKRIAFRNPDEDLCVYDLEKGESILWVPEMAVVTDAMYFVEDDTSLLMLCANGTCSTASIYLGPEQTWEGFIYTPYYVDISRIQVREDAAGDEVYLFSSAGEFEGWIYWDLLSQPKGCSQVMLGYLPESNALLCTDEAYMQLLIQRRLNLEDMIAMGEDLLGK